MFPGFSREMCPVEINGELRIQEEIGVRESGPAGYDATSWCLDMHQSVQDVRPSRMIPVVTRPHNMQVRYYRHPENRGQQTRDSDSESKSIRYSYYSRKEKY
ncbi:hypothetical protein KQX54_009828 [Cotesia glomerata]|uniref:Uncharacterized protein n=1 Tax=Cotesia glomerata TaxID=32391 RepID=A0AAV7IEG6_COTGL|nr:hypothetical protein KQX54_009828 [Cotesia glomerata]